jgi:hypothetical protein
MKTYLNQLIIGVSIILTAIILGNSFKSRNQHDNTISVTGLGEKEFTSDLIVWSGSFTKKSLNLKEAYADLNHDREYIKKYLTSKGVNSESIVFSSINIDKEFDNYYNESRNTNEEIFTGYKLQQNVEIESTEVDKIEAISRQVSELINSGVEFYSNNPEYFYTKLSVLKLQMISEATKDALKRAEKIAENSGSKLGELKKANMGVFQIIAPNSSEDYSWGGSFNTSSKRKKANITMKLDYQVD